MICSIIHKNVYSGVSECADCESFVTYANFVMVDPIWRIKFLKIFSKKFVYGAFRIADQESSIIQYPKLTKKEKKLKTKRKQKNDSRQLSTSAW